MGRLMRAMEVAALLLEGRPEGLKTPEQALGRLRELVKGGTREGRLIWATLRTWAKRGFVPEAQRVDPVILAALSRAVQGIREKVLKLVDPVEEQPGELRDLRGRPVRVDPGDRLDPPRWEEPDPLALRGLQGLQSLVVEEIRETDDGESVYVSSVRTLINEGVLKDLEAVGIFEVPTTRKELVALHDKIVERMKALDERIFNEFEAGPEEETEGDELPSNATLAEIWELLGPDLLGVEEVKEVYSDLDPREEGRVLERAAAYIRARIERIDEGRLVGLQVCDLSRAGAVVLR